MTKAVGSAVDSLGRARRQLKAVEGEVASLQTRIERLTDTLLSDDSDAKQLSGV